MKRTLVIILSLHILMSSVAPFLVYAQEISVASPSAEFAPIASPSAEPSVQELALPTPTIANISAVIRQPARVHALQKHDFTTQELIDISVESDNPESISVAVIGPKGPVQLPVQRKNISDGITLSFAVPSDFVPGKYMITVSDSLGTQTTQDFTWGVLAINTNKSIYIKDEQATIAIAVLDEIGRMVCDADVTLEITDASAQKTLLSTNDGSIHVSTVCKSHDLTVKPDYETFYQAHDTGTYSMQLTAVTKKGTYTITDTFLVKDEIPFSVERTEATRIYPPHTYPVRIPITANEDFTGDIIESVPEGFTISPLEQVASYAAIRVTGSQDVIDIHYPFDKTFAQTLGFGSDVEDPLLKEKYTSFGLDGHDGVDFALPDDTPVLAASAGTVELAGEGVYGTTIVLQHPWGRSYYGHLSQTLVTKGEQVIHGQKIGLSGHTGLATGPHLHFGIRPYTPDMKNGYVGKIDPNPILVNPASQKDGQRNIITWHVSLKKGESITLGYQYKAPQMSPQLHLTGPLQFIDAKDINKQKNVSVFREARQWQIAADATFSMQTGYYVGDGTDDRAITGLGFSPSMVMIKDHNTSGDEGIIWKNTAMTSEVTAKLSESEADVATDNIQSLDSDGFTVGTDADVNAANVLYYWMAFGGSDCTSSGTFCTGSYTGTGASLSVNTGFQPDLVVTKRSGINGAVWLSSSMAANATNFFAATTEDTGGQHIKTLDSTGFTVGTNQRVNVLNDTYWFFVFKQVSGAMDVGKYTGNATDNRDITSSDDAGLTFTPNLVFLKNSNAGTPVAGSFNVSENYGDLSLSVGDAGSTTDVIQKLNAGGGFQVGAGSGANGSGNTIYYAAFGGAASHSSSGTYTMATGSYSGTGSTQSVTTVGFQPDLVIIKHNDQATDQYAVFKTSMMSGDKTAYFANAATSFTGGITSLDSGGFTVGTGATVNTSGDTYYWTAYGNSWKPDKNTGASDFAVGQYIGTGADSTDITRLPFQPSLVTVKVDSGVVGQWRSTANSGDLTDFFSAAAEAADLVQALNSDGFQIGTGAGVNTSANIYYYFTFKAGANMVIGTYTGIGSSQDITSPGIQPNHIWVKKSTGGTARGGISRTSAQSGDAAQPFLNSPTTTGDITAILSNGFTVGTGNLANENTFTYHYATWLIPSTSPTLDQLMRHGNWFTSAGVEQTFTF